MTDRGGRSLEMLDTQELAGGRLGGDVRFSSDGKRLIETGLNGEVSIWRTDTGEKICDYAQVTAAQETGDAESKYHREQLPRVISDDGQRVATLRSRASTSRHRRVDHAWFTDDGQQIVTRSAGRKAQLWDAASGEYTGELPGTPQRERAPPFEPERLKVVLRFSDRSLDIRDEPTGRTILRLENQTSHVRAVYSPDRRRVLTTSWNGTAAIWDTDSSEHIASLTGHAGGISTGKFSADGRRVLTASWDKTAAVWDAVSGERVVELVGHANGLTTASFSPDGRWVVTASRDKTAAVWEAETGKQLAVLIGHTGAVGIASFSPDGKRIVTASEDKTAAVWEAATGTRVATLTKRTNYSQGASWLVGGRPDHRSPIVIGTPNRNHKPDPRRALISPDSRWLFYRDRLHDIHGPSRSTVLLPSMPAGGVVRFSAQPGRIAVFGPTGAIVWDFGDPDRLFVGNSRYRGGRAAKIVSSIPSPTHFGTFVGFDSAGEFLLTYKDSVSVWDIAAQKCVLNLGFGDTQVTSAGFSFDASQIIVLCSDGIVRIARRESGKTDAEIRAQGASVVSIHEGPEMGTFAAICSDETLRIFDASKGALLAAAQVGPIDALTCRLRGNRGQIAVLRESLIRRWLFTKVGERAEDGALHFRLDGRPLQSKADVAAFLQVPMSVLNRALKGDSSEPRYRSYEIPKRTGGKRRIDAPSAVLRSLQQELNPLLQSVYDAHSSAHGFVADRSIVSNATPHTAKRWVLNVDLADFFASINLPAIKALFSKTPFRMGQAAAQTVAELCTYRYGLPQGAPTSPVLSNMAAAKLDVRLERLALKFKLTYSRYADDITLSTNAMVFPPEIATITVTPAGQRLVEVGRELSKTVEGCGFRIKHPKTRLQHASQRQEVTGLGVNGKVNVARKRIRRLRAMLHAWRKHGLEGAAWEHFRKYSPRGRALPPRHFVPTRSWQRDSVTNSWTKQTEWERRYPDAHRTPMRSPEWKTRTYRSFDPGGSSVRRIVPASFRRIIIGNLAYLHMVRGADDPVLAKLCLGLAKLDPKVPRFVAAIVARHATDAGEKSEARPPGSSLRTSSVEAESTDRVSVAPISTFFSKPLEPEMVLIPAGRLTPRPANSHAEDVATPSSSARIVETFALARFALTFEAWDICIEDGHGTLTQCLDLERPSDRGWGRGTRPVINVSWCDAQLYIAWLNRMLGLTGRTDAYRLPTELEWEYACRAGASTRYHQGDMITTDDANFDGRATRNAAAAGEYRRQTMPVGSFAPNAWGLHEMHGNVWEWCAPDSAQTFSSDSRRALRGGSWSNTAIKLQAGNRWEAPADYRAANIGFRLARNVAER